MYPRGNQPEKLYRTTKTHEFNNIQENNKEKLKLCSIIDQTETYSCNPAHVISQYLEPISSHQISKTCYISNIYKKVKNIAINETIDYVLDQLYNKKKLKPFFSRLILEVNTEVPFNINFCFFLA